MDGEGPVVEKLLFGWCERGEHDKCPGKKKTEAASHIYFCTCGHHEGKEALPA